MRVLIIGGGMVGAYSARQLMNNSHEVLIADIQPNIPLLDWCIEGEYEYRQINISNLIAYSNLFEYWSPDVVIFTAGVMENKIAELAAISLKTNIVDMIGITDLCVKKKIKKIVYSSSLAVYNFEDKNNPFKETSPKTNSNIYGLGKLICEEYLNRISKDQRIHVISLRFCGIYGAGHFYGGAWMGSYIQEIALQALQGERNSKIILQDSILGTNEYLYAGDVASAIYNATVSNECGEFNIGPGQLTTIFDVNSSIQNHFPKQFIEIQSSNANLRDSRDRKHALDITAAKKSGLLQLQYPTFDKGFSAYCDELSEISNKHPKIYSLLIKQLRNTNINENSMGKIQ